MAERTVYPLGPEALEALRQTAVGRMLVARGEQVTGADVRWQDSDRVWWSTVVRWRRSHVEAQG